MDHIENRNEVRTSNQFKLIQLLRENDETITDIANKLSISFTAAANIVEELKNEGLITYIKSKSTKTKKGRIPFKIALNNDRGVVCGIDISTTDLTVFIADINGKILCQDAINNVRIVEQRHFEQMGEIIKKLLAEDIVKGRKLLSICVTSPGMIRRDNYEYACAFRIKNCEKVNPVLLYKNMFGVDVEMHNDVRIACLGELKYGAFPKTSFDGAFVHIGYGSGYSLIFNGKIYNGSNNFAGELPSFTDYDDFSKFNRGGDLSNIWSLGINYCRDKNIEFSDKENLQVLLDIYEQKDPVLLKHFEENLKLNAASILSLITILDLDYLVVEGDILKFGNDYIDKLRKLIMEYSKNELRTNILVSSVKEHPVTILGTCYRAISIYLNKSLEKLNQKRINSPNYTLDKTYNEL